MKIKSFQFTTGIDPKTEIHFSGASGKPLEISFASKETSARFMLDTDSVLRLQAFLADYLQPEDNNNHAPVYAPTGRAIAIMDWDTLDIIRVFKIKNVSGFEQAETESYDSLSNIIRNSIDIELPKQMIFIFFETYDGSINQSLLRRILRACISYQIDYVRTGDLLKSRPMTQKDIEDFTTIDISRISRATRNVLILSPQGTFTLNSANFDLEKPALFDEDIMATDDHHYSRKTILSYIKEIIEEEDQTIPITDDGIVEKLAEKGIKLSRRVIAKYRGALGIPSSHHRHRA